MLRSNPPIGIRRESAKRDSFRALRMRVKGTLPMKLIIDINVSGGPRGAKLEIAQAIELLEELLAHYREEE